MTEEQVYEILKPHLVAILERNCVGSDSIRMEVGKQFASVQYIRPDQMPGKNAGQLVFRILARNGKYAFDIPCVGGYESVPFLPTEDGISAHISAIQHALDSAIDAGACEYSCCSRAEQCSDARRCVNPYPHIAANCNYRKILKSGKIFYGKNRNVD